MLGQTY